MRLDGELQDAVVRLHASGQRAVAICAGAGASAFAWLHAVPGSSHTVVELVSAYARASVDAWLGVSPASYACPGTAAALARAARARALALGEGVEARGIGLVAAIATDLVRRARPRISCAVHGAAGVRVHTVALGANAPEGNALSERARHEDLAARLVLNAWSAEARLAYPLADGEEVHEEGEPIDGLCLAVLGGHLSRFVVPSTGAASAMFPPPSALLAGSFDPLHDGHVGLARAAGEELGCEVGFELSLANADKGSIGLDAALARIAQFVGCGTLVVDRAATFLEKAKSMPGTTFVVGIDTAVRLLDPRYYGGVEGRDRALAEIAAHRGRFLVAGRFADGVYRSAESLALPPSHAAMFRAVPEARFRLDCSSSELRQLGRTAGRIDRVEEGSA